LSTTTTKWAIGKLAGVDPGASIDDVTAAAMDTIDGLLTPYSEGVMSARPTSTAGSPGKQGRVFKATDAGGVEFRDRGTSWSQIGRPQLVTALPSGTGFPFDGMEVYYLADQTNGIVWHLRYRAFQADGTTANPSAYKWEAIGGRPLRAYVATLEGRSSSVYGDLTTFGPFLTAPLAGDYDMRVGSFVLAPGVQGYATHSVSIGGAAVVDRDGPSLRGDTSQQAQATLDVPRRLTGLAASTQITSKYNWTGASGTAQWDSRFLELAPVRVG
jgi:hypothetical protein